MHGTEYIASTVQWWGGLHFATVPAQILPFVGTKATIDVFETRDLTCLFCITLDRLLCIARGPCSWQGWMGRHMVTPAHSARPKCHAESTLCMVMHLYQSCLQPHDVCVNAGSHASNQQHVNDRWHRSLPHSSAATAEMLVSRCSAWTLQQTARSRVCRHSPHFALTTSGQCWPAAAEQCCPG